MEIRVATKEDQPEIVRMFVALWPDESDEEHRTEVERIFASPKEEFFVIERGEGVRLAGFISLNERSVAEGCWDGPVGYVEGWFVDEDLRGQGWGKKLIQQGMTWAKEKGYKHLASDAELENVGSIAAHKAIGFEETERLVTFKIDLT
jgi:aminoglycoside 6'-N-acetyltransferase I